MYNIKLWKTSGHYDNYSENMFCFNIENEEYALKPMNCPGHCLMYGVRPRSWRELPIRYADFGVLHRNEFSGALSGLTRVRRFCQDDAHIFCRLEQVGEEIKACLDFLFFVHTILGFDLHIKLSTRPDKSIGEDFVWEKAESELKRALDECGKKWELNPGDGAFYGPKIDIQVKDALCRFHQISTIQLDFNLPSRFQLKYVNADDTLNQPVMIHRAILGSLERVIGVLTETYAGKWPFWLSPNQVVIISFKPEIDDYAYSIHRKLTSLGYTSRVDDDPTVSFNKKIRRCSQSLCNFTIIVGNKELENKTLSLRTRNNKQINDKTIDDVIKHFENLQKNYSVSDDLDF
uniref:threonine--tRNA ligase n=1 Tax=Henneguya salminicola TaxID=69463 RepID=A0A6G3MDR0_HENSL